MLLKSVVPWLLLTASLGFRAGVTRQAVGSTGIPDVEVLYTSDVEEAASFLRQWSDDHNFGLYIRLTRSDQSGMGRRIQRLGICRGSRVLLFDLEPFLHEAPQALPAPLAEFLEDKHHTFYGEGLFKSAARLAFEFDVVVRCVDYGRRAWPDLQRRIQGGLYKVADQVLGFGLRRPRTLESLSSQAVHTFLQWSVAHYFLMFHGEVREDWVMTESDLYGAGPVFSRSAHARRDRAAARSAWLQRMLGNAAGAMRRTLRMFHQQGRLHNLHQQHDITRQHLEAAPTPAIAAQTGRGRYADWRARLAREFEQAGENGELRPPLEKHLDWPPAPQGLDVFEPRPEKMPPQWKGELLEAGLEGFEARPEGRYRERQTLSRSPNAAEGDWRLDAHVAPEEWGAAETAAGLAIAMRRMRASSPEGFEHAGI
mmetsp:Transcript_15736/g.45458  ORF Transcript_15736/g.45458 Transcript_15736/m.45458 type:complete len:425 (+) Transcript_15736:71-1345(+)